MPKHELTVGAEDYDLNMALCCSCSVAPIETWYMDAPLSEIAAAGKKHLEEFAKKKNHWQRCKNCGFRVEQVVLDFALIWVHCRSEMALCHNHYDGTPAPGKVAEPEDGAI